MQQHKNISQTTIWNKENSQWGKGKKNAADKPIRMWYCWQIQGHPTSEYFLIGDSSQVGGVYHAQRHL